MLATLCRKRCFSAVPVTFEAYFAKLDSLTKHRNESEQNYDAYLQHLDAYHTLLPHLSDELLPKSLQRLTDNVFSAKAPLSHLIKQMNNLFDHKPEVD